MISDEIDPFFLDYAGTIYWFSECDIVTCSREVERYVREQLILSDSFIAPEETTEALRRRIEISILNTAKLLT